MRLVPAFVLLLIVNYESIPRQTGEVEEFTRLERQWMDALAAKDEVTLERILAREFSIIGAGSTVDEPVAERGTWLQNALSRPWPKHEVTKVRVTRAGDVAVVQCLLSGDYPPRSLTPEGGRLQFLITDVWVQRDGRWQVLTRHSSVPRSTAGR